MKKHLKPLGIGMLFLSISLIVTTSCEEEVFSIEEDSEESFFGTTPPPDSSDLDSGHVFFETDANNEVSAEENRYDEMIETATYGLLDLAENSSFRTIVHNRIAEQFDGDDNALLKTIEIDHASLESDMTTALNSRGYGSHSANVHNAVEGFDYYTGKAFIQIYIPFIDQVDLNSTPIICMNKNDDDILPGYYINSEDEVVQTNVNESMAQTNLIWVVSVNEMVDDSGEVDTTEYYSYKRTTGVVMHLIKTKIKDKKEKWGNGKAEFAYAGWKKPSSSCTANLIYSAPYAAKISDNNVGNWVIIRTLTMSISNLWLSSEQVSFIVYERDKRVKYEKSGATYYSSCPNLKLYYISKESAYGAVYPQWSWFNSSSTQTNWYYESRHGDLSDCDMKLTGSTW